MITELEQNIRAVTNLGRPTATGFETLKCPLCNDSKVRAGFKFSATEIGYNCFRGKCGEAFRYEDGGRLSSGFRKLLDALGAEIPPSIFLNQKRAPTLDTNLYEYHSWNEMELPAQFVPLTKEQFPAHWQYVVRRHVSHYKFYVGTSLEWKNRLIIPHYYLGKLVGWQGVVIEDIPTQIKYLKASGNTDLVFAPTGKIPKYPVIVEGVMDALSIPNGVAVLQSKITKKQAYFFRNSDPVVIPDRKDSNLIDFADKYKWRVSLPQWKGNDANAARSIYGKFVTCRMIHDGICRDMFEARLRYKEWAQR